MKQLDSIGKLIDQKIDKYKLRSIYLFQPDELFDFFNEEKLIGY